MRLKIYVGFVIAMALATAAGAQTKISETVQCGKPDDQKAFEVGDRMGHMLSVGKSNCKATTPWEIEGIQNKEGVSVAVNDTTGNKSRTRGYYTDTMANGDKTFFRYEGPGTLKDGATESAEVKWTLTGGTGKLKGVKGKGTCKGKGAADGGVTWDCEGEYEMPKAAK